MPYNGSGTFNRIHNWSTDAANSIAISSSEMDAEDNGFAAGLTNCITRDGQSPPSADIPWGGKKITNLGLASVSTDALSQAAGDARYLRSGVTLTGPITVSGAFNVTSGDVQVISNARGIMFTDAAGGHPYIVARSDNTLAFHGTDGTGAIRLAFTIPLQSSSGAIAFAINATGITQATSDNSTLLATTAYVKANVTGLAPLASPTFTGAPAAPTAASGTATTQLATTAFVDALRDVPSNAKAASYTLALTDRGGGVDFNGASLTCTIPANASVAFPVGTTIVLTNLNASALSIAIATDTLTLAGSTSTGTRTLAQNGMATLRKVGATSWLISGAGLT